MMFIAVEEEIRWGHLFLWCPWSSSEWTSKKEAQKKCNVIQGRRETILQRDIVVQSSWLWVWRVNNSRLENKRSSSYFRMKSSDPFSVLFSCEGDFLRRILCLSGQKFGIKYPFLWSLSQKTCAGRTRQTFISEFTCSLWFTPLTIMNLYFLEISVMAIHAYPLWCVVENNNLDLAMIVPEDSSQ
jgi:hypothetical protein